MVDGKAGLQPVHPIVHHIPQETELPRQRPNEIPHNEKLLSLKYEVSAHLPHLSSALWDEQVSYEG